MRKYLSFSLMVLVIVAASPAARAATGESGLPTQSWFAESSADLRGDLALAAKDGKILAVVWEQRGCYYCKQMHEVNFQIDEIVDYVRANFHLQQLNLRGEREIVGFDGEARSEAGLARKYAVTGTPSIQFFDGGGRELFRMPGYATPAVFLAVFEYVMEKGYRDLSFRDWFKAKFEREQKTSR